MRKNKIVRDLLFLISFTFLNVMSIHATVLEQMSLNKLTEESDIIIVGQCSKVQSFWGGKSLRTRISMEITETLKGTALGSVDIEQPGGRVQKPIPVKMNTPGLASFKEGEEVVVFLKKKKVTETTYQTGSEIFQVIGGVQGKLCVKTDPDTKEKRVICPFHDKVPPRKVSLEKMDSQNSKSMDKATRTTRLEEIEALSCDQPSLNAFKNYIKGICSDRSEEKKNKNE